MKYIIYCNLEQENAIQFMINKTHEELKMIMDESYDFTASNVIECDKNALYLAKWGFMHLTEILLKQERPLRTGPDISALVLAYCLDDKCMY